MYTWRVSTWRIDRGDQTPNHLLPFYSQRAGGRLEARVGLLQLDGRKVEEAHHLVRDAMGRVAPAEQSGDAPQPPVSG